MPITTEDVQKMAKLARLDIPQETQELFAGQFANILGHMNTLSQVDTEGVEPLYSPVLHESVLREDVAKSHARDAKDILGNAPATDDIYFCVPRIV